MGEKTFVLSGSSDHGNVASQFSDGKDGGKLNVVKEGSGTWALVKPTSFTGELIVTGGVLKVENNSNYRWYRMNFTENGFGSSRYDTTYSFGTNSDGSPKLPSKDTEYVMLQIHEWAMYDADGNNLLSNLTSGEPGPVVQYDYDGNYRTQAIKSVVLATKDYCYFNPGLENYSGNGFLSNLFDNAATKIHTYRGKEGNKRGITQDNPASWIQIVVRLPDDAPAPAKLDFYSALSSSGSYNGRILTAYRLDASVDGVNWDIGISQNNALDAPESGSRWYSDHADSKMSKTRTGGFPIAKTKPDSVASHAFSTIGVSCGGVLEVVGDPIEVSGLVVDASASAGTISNFKFAASGTVDVRNAEFVDGEPLELPGDYSHLEGVGNLAKWGLVLDGEYVASKVLGVKNGKLTVYNRGIRVIFR